MQVSLANDEDKQRREDPVTTVYKFVKEMALRTKRTSFTVDEISSRITTSGIKREVVVQAVREYAGINVWSVEADSNGVPVAITLDEDIAGVDAGNQ